MDQLVGGDNSVSGMTGTLEAEPEHLVSDGEIGYAIADLGDDAGQIAALAGGECGGELLH
jgi:hypothetical protein